MPDPTTDPPPSRRWLRWMVGISLLPLGIAAFYLIENYRGEKAWAAEKARLEAEGISLDFYSYLPSAADIPDEQNVAEAEPFRSLVPGEGIPALYAVYRPFMRTYYGSFSSGELPEFEGQLPGPGGSPVPLSEDPATAAQQILDHLASEQPLLDQIRVACARPHVRFEPLGQPGSNLRFPQTSFTSQIVNVLKLRCAALLTLGRTAEAMADLKLLVRQAEVARAPTLLGAIVGQAILPISATGVWQGLASDKWSDAELGELERLYRGLNPTASLLALHWSGHASMQADMEAYAQDRRKANGEIANVLALTLDSPVDLPPEWQQSRLRMTAALIPTGWLRWNQVNYAARMRGIGGELAGCIENPGMFPISPLTTRQPDDEKPGHIFDFLSKTMGGAEALIYDKTRELMATLAFVRTAIALEQHRRATGSFPDTLAALSPPAPVDPITGRPLYYELLPDGEGFKLWSVGLDGINQGGNNERGRTKPDWVWRSWIRPPEPPAAQGSARELVLPPPPMAAPDALPR